MNEDKEGLASIYLCVVRDGRGQVIHQSEQQFISEIGAITWMRLKASALLKSSSYQLTKDGSIIASGNTTDSEPDIWRFAVPDCDKSRHQG